MHCKLVKQTCNVIIFPTDQCIINQLLFIYMQQAQVLKVTFPAMHL